MRVHHLNCATIRPRSRRLMNGDGGLFEPGHVVCHVLLIETDRGLVRRSTAIRAAAAILAHTECGRGQAGDGTGGGQGPSPRAVDHAGVRLNGRRLRAERQSRNGAPHG